MSHHVYNIVRWRAFPVPSFFALPIGAQKILQLKDDWREFGKAEKGHEDTNVGASKDDGAKTISAWLRDGQHQWVLNPFQNIDAEGE